MKTNFLKMALLCLIVIISVSKINGQSSNEESLQLRPFGLGLHVEQFRFIDLYADSYAAITNNILLVINTGKHFRIEPEIGIISVKAEDDDHPTTGFTLGSGFYGMFNRNKVNFYTGLHLNYSRIKDYSYSGDELALSFIKVGPVLGAEYYFSENFSFGGQVALKFAFFNVKSDSDYTDDNQNTNYLMSETGLFVRFFF